MGETKRTLKVRLSEYRQVVKRGDPKNDIAVHFLQSVVIDSATYLLTLTLLNLPNIDNIAMSLYDITTAIIHR